MVGFGVWGFGGLRFGVWVWSGGVFIVDGEEVGVLRVQEREPTSRLQKQAKMDAHLMVETAPNNTHQSAGTATQTLNQHETERGEEWKTGDAQLSGVQYHTADGAVRTAHAHLTVVCDGMFSRFRCAWVFKP